MQNVANDVSPFYRPFLDGFKDAPDLFLESKDELTSFAEAVVANLRLYYHLTKKEALPLLSKVDEFINVSYAFSGAFGLVEDLFKEGVLFTIPRFDAKQASQVHKEGDIDFASLFMKVGSLCGTLEYLKSVNVCDFTLFGQISEKMGSFSVYSSTQGDYQFKNVPGIHFLFTAPSLFFFLTGSAVAVNDWLRVTYLSYQKNQKIDVFTVDFFKNTLPAINRCVMFEIEPFFAAANPIGFLVLNSFTKSCREVAYIIEVNRNRKQIS